MSDTADRLGTKLPSCDTSDPAQLEAWFGPFGFADHWRKVVLGNCREIVRATFALKGEKVSEARLDDLARTHNTYINFLIETLEGRRIREMMVRESVNSGSGWVSR